MNDEKVKYRIQSCDWSSVRETVQHGNAELAELIDTLSPGKSDYLYRITYPYGANIIRQGCLNVPSTDGATVTNLTGIKDKKILTDLNYRQIPLSLVLHKAAEVYIEEQNRIVPLRLLRPGELFGVFELFDAPNRQISASITNVSAGARSAFMLPKISNALHYKKLIKAYDLQSPLPQHLMDHSSIFAEINRQQPVDDQWCCEVLVFPAHWFGHKSDVAWEAFNNYLLKIAWNQSQYWRMHTTFGLSWKKFIAAILAKNIRPRPFQIDTIKHLVFIAAGAAPGFMPTGRDEIACPVNTIQKAYTDIYELKHSPIIMQPDHFAFDQSASTYYSLSLPTLIESSLNPRQKPTILEDLREIKMLMALLNERLAKEPDLMYDILRHCDFHYFHCDHDVLQAVEPSSKLARFDSRFHETWVDDKMSFPGVSPFLRGCIGIGNKQHAEK